MGTTSCQFCDIDAAILSNELAYARYDNFPVSPGHILILPVRHVSDYFETTIEEKQAIFSLLNEAKNILDNDRSPDGYNIGINAGLVAGQTIMHAHIHLIPRFKNDVGDPRGGVRCVIPGKQKY